MERRCRLLAVGGCLARCRKYEERELEIAEIEEIVSNRASLDIVNVRTIIFQDQEFGTNGIRRKVKVFQQPHYTENIIQCILWTIGSELHEDSIVIGGDGRYYNKKIALKIIQMCAANGVNKVYVGQNALLSTPAVSAVIRVCHAKGGFNLSASHNPGGPEFDFGIKFDNEHGGPASVTVTETISKFSTQIKGYRIVPDLKVDLSQIGVKTFIVNEKPFYVEIIDSVETYVEVVKHIFDFCAIRKFLVHGYGNGTFNILTDSMYGASGPYVKRIFVDELGVDPNSLLNITPLTDFGHKAPDPNRNSAVELMSLMETGRFDIGFVFDGDSDRVMIVGDEGFYVSPSDSLAFLAANIGCIPYFQRKGIFGFARSMPTSRAVDKVAEKLGLPVYEVPTGWKFFANYIEAGRISICGEESFGTGSCHIREKDAIWTALAWLSVLAHLRMPVQCAIANHWAEYGRNFYVRADFENCDPDQCKRMMDELFVQAERPEWIGQPYESDDEVYIITKAFNYRYVDPFDATLIKNQGIVVELSDDSRLVFRLSGTRSTNATVRMYVESYRDDPETYEQDAATFLQPLVNIGMEILQIKDFTDLQKPTNIT